MPVSGIRANWIVWAVIVGIVAGGSALVFAVADDSAGGDALRGWIDTAALAFFGLSLLAVLANWLITLRKRSGRQE